MASLMSTLALFVIVCLYAVSVVADSYDQAVRYDKNVNLFSSNGELLQVQYARKAGERGSAVLCSHTSSGEVVVCIPTAKSVQALQDRQSVDKLSKVSEGIWFTFAGLAGDGRALLKAARSFCTEYQSKFGSTPAVRSVARYIGELQHDCTLSGGRRPFGVQVLLIGEDDNKGSLEIYNSEPSGITASACDKFASLFCFRYTKIYRRNNHLESCGDRKAFR
jgi:20S proteasome alpha/beta subunit